MQVGDRVRIKGIDAEGAQSVWADMKGTVIEVNEMGALPIGVEIDGINYDDGFHSSFVKGTPFEPEELEVVS